MAVKVSAIDSFLQKLKNLPLVNLVEVKTAIEIIDVVIAKSGMIVSRKHLITILLSQLLGVKERSSRD